MTEKLIKIIHALKENGHFTGAAVVLCFLPLLYLEAYLENESMTVLIVSFISFVVNTSCLGRLIQHIAKR